MSPRHRSRRTAACLLGLVSAVALSGLSAVAVPAAGADDAPAASWGPLSVLSADAEEIQVDVSDDGSRAVAVWSDASDDAVYAAAATVAGNAASWGTPVALTAPGRAGSDADVAVSGDGTVAAFTWQDAAAASGQPWTATIAAAAVTGTTVAPGAAVPLGTASDTNSVGETAVGLSRSGSMATAAWTRRLASGREVATRSATVSGTTATLGATTVLATGPTSHQNIDLALSREGGTAALIWRAGTDVLAAAASISGATGTWGTPAAVNTMGVTSSPYPGIELSDDGTVASAAWRQETATIGNESPASRSALVTGSTFDWGSVTQLMADDSTSDVVTLGMSADGRTALAVYEDQTAPNITGFVRSRVASINGKNQTWGAESGPVGTEDVDEMDSALSADGAVGLSVWEGRAGKTNSVNSATVRISGTGHVWSTPQEITDDARFGTYPKLGLSRGGCRATTAWESSGDTSGDSRSAVLACATPTVTAVSPPSGPTAGGTAITITGSGFYPGATVSVGGQVCRDVVVASATTITCVTPAAPAATVAIVVTNDDGQQATLPSAFTYVAVAPSPTTSPTPSPTTSPTPTPKPTPKPQTRLRVADAAKRAVPLERRTRLVRATTNGRFTVVRARCVYQGNTLRGRAARKLCDLRTVRSRQAVRVSSAPSCTTGLRLQVVLRARKATAPAKTWSRSWRVRGEQTRCTLPGTG